MGFLKTLFGGGEKAPETLTAHEACTLAKRALQEKTPTEAESASLCCLYTSTMDSDAVVTDDGKCSAWHVDFFLPESRTLALVRIRKGRARIEERPWDKTEPAPPKNSVAVICTTDELYEKDCFLFYIDAVTGKIALQHTFRFPDLFFFGSSCDW